MTLRSIDGAFHITASGFRHHIKVGSQYPPEANRYHLYVSFACPFASRCLAVRAFKGLQDVIGLSVVHTTYQKTKPDTTDNHVGWVFKNPGDPSLTSSTGYGSFPCDDAMIPDYVNGCKTIRELYEMSGDMVGRFSVPVLWDKKTSTIVNNESSEIIVMFNSEFNHLAKNPVDLAPSSLLQKMKEVDDWISLTINEGVYKCGFARSQEAYEDAFDKLFSSLDRVEEILSKSRYLVGNTFTLSDIRLFVTLIRFDEVYVVYFKCNKHFIHEHYPNIFNYIKDIYQIPGIASSVNMTHIKRHYYSSHPHLNEYAIIPKGNPIDFNAPHDRNRFAVTV